jgi:ribosomal protein S3AE
MAERKKYIEVKVPIIRSGLRVLGTPEELHNKTIKLDMTRKMRGKGLNLTLRILNNEGKLVAFPNKMELVKSYIRRMMRKRTDYVEDSFKAKAADVEVIIKPFLITRKRVSRAVRRNLRNTAKEFLLEYVKEREYNDLCQEIMAGILQKSLLPKLKKVYPLSFCDIRVFGTKELEKLDIKKLLAQIEKEKIEVEKEETDVQKEEEKESNKENPAEEREAEEEKSEEKEDEKEEEEKEETEDAEKVKVEEKKND